MPYQNRVNPFGELFQPESGAVLALTGNRGRLHGAGGRSCDPTSTGAGSSAAWTTPGRPMPSWRRALDAPVFLDEATALAPVTGVRALLIPAV
jgi:hypothetical protein